MSDGKIIQIEPRRIIHRGKISNRERIVYSYHSAVEGNWGETKALLSKVSDEYLESELYQDLSRALLCWITQHMTGTVYNHEMQKEAEFYQVVYNLTKMVVEKKPIGPEYQIFYHLIGTLFRDFSI
jgi:hypothetical protein